MNFHLSTILLSFIEGLGLILSPCILPILPIILAGSLTGSKKRPIGIVLGFVITFALFTFFSKQIIHIFSIDLTLIRNISFGLLIAFGIIMFSNKLSDLFFRFTQPLANIGVELSKHQKEGFFSGVIFGGLVGFIWTPCAGPILAAVIVQTVIQHTTWDSFFVVLAFGVGAAIPMLLIALLGKKMMSKIHFFKVHSEIIRKILGAIIIASVIYMVYGGNWNVSFNNQTMNINKNKLINGLLQPYSAPEIQGVTEWINSTPITLTQLKGKVVLIDFWAYSCINCLRTLPYLKGWYDKYHNKGFEIIGIHSPEFDFEKDFNNVKNAVIADGIRYPVVLDNQFITWQNYANKYWPAHYLIDQNGFVVYEHFGEGEYDVTENNIRFLLGLNKASLGESKRNISFNETPETYLGYARMNTYASPETITYGQSAIYSFPKELQQNEWALQGSWKVAAQKIISTAPNASIKIHFSARKIFIVMGSATVFPIDVKLLLNDKLVQDEKGRDVEGSMMTVMKHTLYEAIVFKEPSDGVLQITAMEPGLEVYTFTFGS